MSARPLPRQRRSHPVAWTLLIVAFAWTVDHVAQPVSPHRSGAPRRVALATGSPMAARAVAYARSQLGKPYQWGAEGPGAFDCSGLAWAAWRHAGLGWERMTAAGQWQTLRAHEVARSALRPGDLVFYAYHLGDWRSIHHVGLYVGHGLMVEAPRTGADLRLASINRAGWFGAARPGGAR